MLKTLTFTVSIPSKSGFFGRKCPARGCGKYFKVHEDSLRDNVCCAYCGTTSSKNEFVTPDQERHTKAQAVEQATEYASRELNKQLEKLVKGFNRKGSFIKMDLKKNNYKPRPVFPSYNEKAVDSELTCPECSSVFQVYGIFGYCPNCRSENTQIYDANARIILQEIEASGGSARTLRHAYSDIVSAFESFCAKKAPKQIKNTNFQNLFDTRKAFRKAIGINIFNDLETEELLALRRVFLKRHANIHAGGVIGERYVRMIPEDRMLLGTKVVMSPEEFEAGVKALRKVVDRIRLAQNTMLLPN